MPLESLPRWSILPNWRQPVIERLETLTSVMQSPSGAEQRFAARWSPRRSFEALFTPVGPVRTLFDMSVGSVGVSPWYVPIWHDGQALSAGLTSNQTVIPVETLHREFRSGSLVMLWADEFTTEVLEVASVASDSITVVMGSSATWPAGTMLFPALKARMLEMPTMQRFGPRVLENSIRFDSAVENDFTDAAVTLGLPEYSGLSVLTTRPDEGQDITHGWARLFEEIDGETGLRRRYDTASLDFTLQRHHWLSLGRREHAELRTLFYTLDGRRLPLWLPTFAEDFRVVSPFNALDTEIEVERCGFTAYGGPRFGREDIWIAMRDGTNLFRHVTGSSLTVGGTELVQLNSALGASGNPADIARVSFMMPARLDGDVMEITHYSDASGASRTALVFRSAPETRTAVDPPINVPENTTMNDAPCGACTPGIELTGEAFLLAPDNIESSVVQPHLYRYGTPQFAVSGAGAFVATYNQGTQDQVRVVAVSSADTLSDVTEIFDVSALSGRRSMATALTDGGVKALGNLSFSTGFAFYNESRAQTFSFGGVATSSAVTALAAGEAYGVAQAAAGGYYVLGYGRTSGDQFRVTRFDSDNAVVSFSSVLFTDSNLWAIESLRLARSGDFLAATHLRDDSAGGVKNARLSMHIVSADASTVVGPITVSDVTPLSADSYDRLLDVNPVPGGFAVTWVDSPYGENSWIDANVRIRLFNTDGTPRGASSHLLDTELADAFFDDEPLRYPRHAWVSPGGKYAAIAYNNIVYIDPPSGRAVSVELDVFEFDGVAWNNIQNLRASDLAPLTTGLFDAYVFSPASGQIAAAYSAKNVSNNFELRYNRYNLTECL